MEIKDVENLAKLARIDLAEEEKASLLKDMEGILEYVKVISNVEVSGANNVENEEYVVRNVWREDNTDDRSFSPAVITSQFPDSQDNFLKVKKIL